MNFWSVSLLSAMFAVPVLAKTLQVIPIPADGGLSKHCTLDFDDYGVKYNLCPLFSSNKDGKGSVTLERQTPPTITTIRYEYSLSGPLAVDGTLPKELQCLPGAWVCQTTRNRRRSQPSSQEQVIEVIAAAGALQTHGKDEHGKGHEDEMLPPQDTQLAMAAAYEEECGWGKDAKCARVLNVRLRGGWHVESEQHALFKMRCLEDASGDAASHSKEPIYKYTWNGTHTFEWQTKHACVNVPAKPDPPKDDSDEDRPPPQDSEEQHGERPPADEFEPGQRQEVRKPILKRSGVISGIVFASVLLSAILLTIVYRTPRLRAAFDSLHLSFRARQAAYKAHTFVQRYHPLARLYRKFTFRVGEGTLLRWAHEDGYEMLDGLDGEEGQFVGAGTGLNDARWTGLSVSEEVPLTPGWQVKGFKGYGTR